MANGPRTCPRMRRMSSNMRRCSADRSSSLMAGNRDMVGSQNPSLLPRLSYETELGKVARRQPHPVRLHTGRADWHPSCERDFALFGRFLPRLGRATMRGLFLEHLATM